MYNNEQKMGFIEQEVTKGSEKNVTIQFSTMSKAEESLGKDLCDFNTEEIINYYKGRSYTSYLSIYMMNRTLAWYTDWCIANGFVRDNTNHYTEVGDREILESCLNPARREAIFITKENLLEDIAALPNPCDQFLPLAMFEGITPMELKELTMDDFEGDFVNLPERRLKISEELRVYADRSAAMYDIYPFDYKADPPCYSESPSQMTHYRESDARIIKEKMNAGAGSYIRRINLALNRVGAVLGKVVYSAVRLKNAGQVEFMRRFYEVDPVCGSMRDIIAYHKEEIEQRYGKITIAFQQRYGEYLEP